MHCSGVIDTAFYDEINIGNRLKVKSQFSIIKHYGRHALLLERLKQKFFFLSDQRVKQTDSHSPQSSSLSGASARVGGLSSVTSSSEPQSGHSNNSPTTVSDASVICALHTGHSLISFLRL
jgi:hypothetical protein